MATTDMKAADHGVWRPACFGVLAALALISSRAQAVEFEPRVTVGITYTDNVALAPEAEESETIYRAEPGFSLTHDSQRISLDANYLMQAFRYSDRGTSEVFHRYDASLRTALVPDVFFLEIGGDRTQSILDPEQSIPQSNLPISGNRADRDEYYVSPSFRYPLGSAITVEGQYRNNWVSFEDTGTLGGSAESEGRDAQFSLDNYRRGSGITWALRYDWRRTDYDESIPFEYQQAAVEFGFWLSGTSRVFAAGGKESAWDMPLDPALEDDFWEAGFSHKVAESLYAEFAAGERSFGSSWRGSLELEFLRGSTSLTYSERPLTEDQTRFRTRRFTDTVSLEDFLTRPGSANRFISKRLEWRINYRLQRTDLSFGIFDGERSDRTSAVGTPLGDEKQRGINVIIGYRLGAKTALRATGTWADRTLEDGTEDELLGITLRAGYELGSRTKLSLEYEHAEERGGTANSSEYVANTISLLLTRTF